jgi:hypothetical protein
VLFNFHGIYAIAYLNLSTRSVECYLNIVSVGYKLHRFVIKLQELEEILSVLLLLEALALGDFDLVTVNLSRDFARRCLPKLDFLITKSYLELLVFILVFSCQNGDVHVFRKIQLLTGAVGIVLRVGSHCYVPAFAKLKRIAMIVESFDLRLVQIASV